MESTRWFKPWPNLIPYLEVTVATSLQPFQGSRFHSPSQVKVWKPFVGCHISKGGFSVPIKAIFIKVSWKIHVGHAMTGPTKKFWTWQFWWLFIGWLEMTLPTFIQQNVAVSGALLLGATWKWMVGRLFSFWDGFLVGAILLSFV